MKKDKELIQIENNNKKWLEDNIQFYRVGESTIEVETPLIDAFGQRIYCFIEQEDEDYRITDDSWIMYKLDPLCEDDEFQETATDIVLGSGFDIDEKSNEIFQICEEDEIPELLNKLSQLQVALSFLK